MIPFLRRMVDIWALLGAVVLCSLVAVNVWAVVANAFGSSFPGAVELSQMLVAVAVFMFLPFCQLNRENVTADIFTSRLNPRGKAALSTIASLVALLFASLLLWRMTLGMLDQRAYDYTTAILAIPIWWAYLPILISLGFLGVAAILTLFEDAKGALAWRP